MASFSEAVLDAFGVNFQVFTIVGGGPSWTLNPGNYTYTANTLDDAKAMAVAHMSDAIGVKAVGMWADRGDPVDSGYSILAV